MKEYTAVQKFPILKAYLEHFSLTSMKNEMPALLSFFFIQGQTTLPYVRLPTGDSHLDLRVHVFWIQPSRTGKSVAWNFIGDVMKNAELDYEFYDPKLFIKEFNVLCDIAKSKKKYKRLYLHWKYQIRL